MKNGRRALFWPAVGLAALALAACGPAATPTATTAVATPVPSPFTSPATPTPAATGSLGIPFSSEQAPTPTDSRLWDSLITYFQGFDASAGYTWQTDVSRTLISPREIQFLYAPRVRPLILDPAQRDTVQKANEWLSEFEPVVAVEVNGEARAYPLQIQLFVVQEIVNDLLGGVPIAVAY